MKPLIEELNNLFQALRAIQSNSKSIEILQNILSDIDN